MNALPKPSKVVADASSMSVSIAEAAGCRSRRQENVADAGSVPAFAASVEIAGTAVLRFGSGLRAGLGGRIGSTEELPRRGSLDPPIPLEVTADGGTGALPLAVPRRETCLAIPHC